MTDTLRTSRLQQAIDVVESLPPEEQQLLLEILAKRLRRQQRQQRLEEIQEIRQDVAKGSIKYGSVQDFLAELDEEQKGQSNRSISSTDSQTNCDRSIDTH